MLKQCIHFVVRATRSFNKRVWRTKKGESGKDGSTDGGMGQRELRF